MGNPAGHNTQGITLNSADYGEIRLDRASLYKGCLVVEKNPPYIYRHILMLKSNQMNN